MATSIARALIRKPPFSSSIFSRSKSISSAYLLSINNNLSPTLRGLSSMIAPGELVDPDPETVSRPNIPLPGRTFSSAKYWHVMMELPKPEGLMSRDQIIAYYINTLAKVFGGSLEEAKKKMFSVSTQHYYFFVCNVSAEISDRIWELPGVQGIYPLSESDIERTDFARTGEPFINGEAVPYDPKYHKGILAMLNGPSLPRKRYIDRNYVYDKAAIVMANTNRRARQEQENQRLQELAARWGIPKAA